MENRRTRPPTICIDTDDRWEMVSSPVRFDLICHLERGAECSVAELAAQLGRPADSLYHHMKRLEESGLVEQSGWRKSGRHAEAIYRLAGDSVEFDFDPVSGENGDRFKRLASALFKSANRAVDAAVGSEAVVSVGALKNFHVRHDTARLQDEHVRQLNEHFEAIESILEASRDQAEGDVHSISWSLAPRIAKVRAKQKKTTKKRSAATKGRREENSS